MKPQPRCRGKALPQSDNGAALLAAVETQLCEFEDLCGVLEHALMQRSWPAVKSGIADSRRVAHALRNALDEAAPARTSAFDEHVRTRIARVQSIRYNQMSRIVQYREAVGERLQLLARWKSALKSIRGKRPVSRLAALDRLT